MQPLARQVEFSTVLERLGFFSLFSCHLNSATEAVISAGLVTSVPLKVEVTPCCVTGNFGTVLLVSLYWRCMPSFTKKQWVLSQVDVLKILSGKGELQRGIHN